MTNKMLAEKLQPLFSEAENRRIEWAVVWGWIGGIAISMLAWTAIIYAVLYVKGWL